MRRALLVLAALLALGAGPVRALDWGGIEPGVTTLEEVRARYGAPSKETRAKLEGYDTVQWVYEGARAPGGIERLTVDFGLLTAAGYRPAVVRIFKLEPKRVVFGRQTVIQGWGVPDGVNKKDGVETFFYREGLLVVFDEANEFAVSLIFAPPQVESAPAAKPSAPPAPAQKAPAPGSSPRR